MPTHPFESHLASSPAFAETRFADLLSFGRREVHTLVDQFGGIDAFVAFELGLYDTYIAPIDVPWVPDVLEPLLIDAPAKKLLEAVTRRAYLLPAPPAPPVVIPVPQGSAAP